MENNNYCWIEVDLKAIEYNIHQTRKIIGNGVKMMAVVKAEAYGHGMVSIARKAQECGVDYLGVSTIFEGIELRKNGIDLPILVMSPPLPHQAGDAVFYNLDVAVSSLDLVQALNEEGEKQGKKAKVHIKIDTGFGRFGIQPNQVKEYVSVLIKHYKNINIVGVFSHLSNYKDSQYSYQQFKDFKNAVKEIQTMVDDSIIRHIANSAATIKFPEMHLDMVRVGNLIYGQSPVKTDAVKFKTTWKFKSKIIHIKKYGKGKRIGYNGEYILKRDSLIGIVPVGRFEGVGLEFENNNINMKVFLKTTMKNFLKLIDHPSFKKYAKIKGNKVNIIGKISMQNCFLDLTDVESVEVGDEVELPVKRIAVKSSIPRIYLQDERKPIISETALLTQEGDSSENSHQKN